MFQILIQGLLLSGLYALIALGFMLIFSIGRTLNLAYGAYLMLGGYSYYWISLVMEWPKMLGILSAIAIGILFGIAKYLVIARPLKGDAVAIEISTLILAIVLQSGIVLVFGDASRILLPVVEGVIIVQGTTVSLNILVASIVSYLVIAGVYLFVNRSAEGLAMSAVSMDVKGAKLSGIKTDHVKLLTWALSGGLGALGGVFFGSYTQLSPDMWVAPLVVSIAVVIVGGIGSIIGTLIVAHIIGFLEVIVVTLFAPELRGVFTMTLIIVILVFRPMGLFGRGEA